MTVANTMSEQIPSAPLNINLGKSCVFFGIWLRDAVAWAPVNPHLVHLLLLVAAETHIVVGSIDLGPAGHA